MIHVQDLRKRFVQGGGGFMGLSRSKARVVQAGMAVQGRAKDVWTPEVAQAFGALIRELA